MEKIGFIGLGSMGNPIASNLAKAGYELYVFDVSKDAVDKIKTVYPSVTQCVTIAKLAGHSDIIFSSLPNDAIVNSTMLGANGIITHCSENTIVIDLSSVAPNTSRNIYEEAKKCGVRYMDIPVSGGVAGAAAGTLSLMAGGDRDTFDRILPILKIIGKNIRYIGTSGTGDAMKLVNNMLLGCNMAALAEALNLGIHLGLDLSTMKQIISISSGRSYASEAKLEKFIMEDCYDDGFAVSLQHKDIGLALEAAKSTKVPLMMAGMAEQIYALAMSKGYSRKDISVLARMWMDN